jgi:hypothetical protein
MVILGNYGFALTVFRILIADNVDIVSLSSEMITLF